MLFSSFDLKSWQFGREFSFVRRILQHNWQNKVQFRILSDLQFSVVSIFLKEAAISLDKIVPEACRQLHLTISFACMGLEIKLTICSRLVNLWKGKRNMDSFHREYYRPILGD